MMTSAHIEKAINQIAHLERDLATFNSACASINNAQDSITDLWIEDVETQNKRDEALELLEQAGKIISSLRLKDRGELQNIRFHLAREILALTESKTAL